MTRRRPKKPKRKSTNQAKGTPQPMTDPSQKLTPDKRPTAATVESASAQSAMSSRTSPMQNLAQKRAKDALKKIEDLVDAGEHSYGNYVSFIKALPATIIMSGLGQALAMENAGSAKTGDVKKGHENLFHHMDDWLRVGWPSSPYGAHNNILNAIVENSETDYIRAQAEALEYLEWLKKFAVAFLVEKDEQGE